MAVEELTHSERLNELFLAVQQRFRTARKNQVQTEDDVFDLPPSREDTGKTPVKKTMTPRSSPRPEPVPEIIPVSDYEPGSDIRSDIADAFTPEEGSLDYFSHTATHCYNVGYQATKPPPKLSTPETRAEARRQARTEKKLIEAKQEEERFHAEMSKRPDDSWLSPTDLSMSGTFLQLAPKESHEETVQRLTEVHANRKVAPPPKQWVGV